MRGDWHVYLVFNDHHALAIERILKSSPGSGRSMVISTIQSARAFRGCEVVHCLPYSSLKAVAAEVFLRRRRKMLHNLFRNLSPDTHVTLYVPHYEHIISNYLAFFLLRGHKLTRVLIPDGILSYYQYRVTWRNIKKQLNYKAVCLATGLNYRILWKSIDFPDGQNSSIYTYCPDLVYHESAKVISIPFQKKTLSKEHEGIVVLGNDIYREDHFDYVKVVAFKISKHSAANQIFFKKHPNVRGEDPFLRCLQELAVGFNVMKIPQSIPVDEMIDLYSIRKIFALGFSTAAIDLQVLYDNQLDISVYNPVLLADSNYTSIFQGLAKKFDLTIES